MKPLSLFLDSVAAPIEVASAIDGLLGSRGLKDDSDEGLRISWKLLDIEALLLPGHGLDDDCGIPFTRFEYQLMLIALERGVACEEYEALYSCLARHMAARLSAELRCSVLVVENLQSVVATFSIGKRCVTASQSAK